MSTLDNNASPTDTSSTDVARLASPGTYELDPTRSRVEFTTRHLFGLGAVRGSLAVIGGKISIAGAPSTPTASQVSVHLAADSFDSGSAGRDKVVKSAGYLDVDAHPQITFVSDLILQNGPDPVVRGSVTARGATAPVDLSLTTITQDESGLTVHASARVDRYAHGLTKGKGMAARYLHVELTVRADRI